MANAIDTTTERVGTITQETEKREMTKAEISGYTKAMDIYVVGPVI